MDKMTNADHHISFNNIRDWISETEKLGELRHIKGASWEEDIGLATELLQHDENAPAHCSMRSPVIKRDSAY